VGRAITVAILAAALALAAPLVAHSAGLGKLTVLSPLGQPLNAEIEIVALRPGEEDTLVARIAPADAFAAAGIEPGSALTGMRFAVERRDGQRILKVTTPQAINEPFVEMLVELQWSSGRLVREYTFLLDPPEYKARDAIAAAPAPMPAKPAAPAADAPRPPALESRPLEPAAPSAAVVTPTPEPAASAAPPVEVVKEPMKEPAKEPAQEPAKEDAKPEDAKPDEAKAQEAKAAAEAKTHETKQGDTLGKIARENLPPGITLNQMLIAIYRANPDAFIRENVNLVRAGRILNIPSAEDIGAVSVDDANALVRSHMSEFREYRSRLAAVPATADAAPGQRDSAGRIETKPEAPKPAAGQDQVRLSKVDPQKPGAAQAARGDDLVARERALREAQSRIQDLEKTVTDLQKMLEIRNQQLAEMQKKAGEKPAATPPAKPAPAPAKPAADAPKPAPAPTPTPTPTPTPAPVAKAPEKPAAEAPKPAAEAPKPAAPAAPVTPAAKPEPAPTAKPKPASPPPMPPEPSLLDEFLDNPLALAALGGVVLFLGGYFAWAWRKKKAAQAKFQTSVIGAAAAGAAAGASISEPTLGGATPPAAAPAASQPPAAMAAEEVDPIAEADVYMAYGRDAQAEEILKEALQKDSSRVPVHAKLLEIYAKRGDPKAFEQSALKLKGLTNGEGPDWEKAAALGRSIDPQNGLYAGAGGVAAAAAPEPPPAAAAPTLDFDIGGAGQASASAPDLTLDAAPKPGAHAGGLDFDVSGAAAQTKEEVSAERTMVVPSTKAEDSGLDFNLDLGAPAEKPAEASAPAPSAPAEDPGLTFDLNIDLGGDKNTEPAPSAAPAADLSTISLDLGAADVSAPASGTDPKWQEIATKLDLAKAYEEMGDKNGARELLNEVMKDGDAAQKGQAEQLLAKLG
jgi:pilus assembly protein FimV